MNEIENKKHVVLGQKYAYATVSLLLGIFCFINLAGMEKAILAMVFGYRRRAATLEINDDCRPVGPVFAALPRGRRAVCRDL